MVTAVISSAPETMMTLSRTAHPDLSTPLSVMTYRYGVPSWVPKQRSGSVINGGEAKDFSDHTGCARC